MKKLELFEKFKEALLSSESAKILDENYVNSLLEFMKNASEEDITQAIGIIEMNNIDQRVVQNGAETVETELAKDMEVLVKRLKKTELKMDESIEQKTASAKSDELLDELDEIS